MTVIVPVYKPALLQVRLPLPSFVIFEFVLLPDVCVFVITISPTVVIVAPLPKLMFPP